MGAGNRAEGSFDQGNDKGVCRVAKHEVGEGEEGLAEIGWREKSEQGVHEGRISASDTKTWVVVEASMAMLRSSLMGNQ